MRQIAQVLGAVRHPAPAGAREPERPVSFAEITAASAFLDFGGVPDGPWPHAGRSPQAAVSTGAPGTASSTARFVGPDPEQRHCGGPGGRRITHGRRGSEHVACEIRSPNLFPFLVANRNAMFLVDRLDGIFHMRLGTGPSIINVAMCVAAFGVVALVVVFAHPASRTDRVAAANATAGSEVAATPAHRSILGRED